MSELYEFDRTSIKANIEIDVSVNVDGIVLGNAIVWELLVIIDKLASFIENVWVVK